MQASQLGFNPIYSEASPTFEEVSALTGDAVLEFGAPWCAHCQAAQPLIEKGLEEHSKNNPELSHIKVYDGKGKKLGRAFKVKIWPTLIMLRDGKEVSRAIRPTQLDDVSRLLEIPDE